MNPELDKPLVFPCGQQMKNRFMLAPMTNLQSYEDGRLSDDEFNWLVKRAEGDFGLTMTCASHVQEVGKGFSGQLGIWSDKHKEGHSRLSRAIREHGSLAVIQLHHAGMRSPEKLIGQAPVSASDDAETGARALSLEEVRQLRDDFIEAAIRSKECGYDGVEVHGAHGYVITQFLSAEINKRADDYGGSAENRARILFEIVRGIRENCGKRFLLGVRLSPERFGLKMEEIQDICRQLIEEGQTDFLDISVWDVYKEPEEEAHKGRSLMSHFTELDYGDVRFTVAGKIRNGKDVQHVMDAGADFVTIGRSAILHHDFPRLVMADPDFEPIPTPVSAQHLANEGLGPKFIEYMRRWKGFVQED